jgi:hypothetical protein
MKNEWYNGAEKVQIRGNFLWKIKQTIHQNYSFRKFLSCAFCGGSKFAKIQKIQKIQKTTLHSFMLKLNNIFTFFWTCHVWYISGVLWW